MQLESAGNVSIYNYELEQESNPLIFVLENQALRRLDYRRLEVIFHIYKHIEDLKRNEYIEFFDIRSKGTNVYDDFP